MTDPWAPPDTARSQPSPRTSLAVVIGVALAVVVVIAGILALVRPWPWSNDGAAATPQAVVAAYLDAAQRGDQDALLALVAPSQRSAARRELLLPGGSSSLEIEGGDLSAAHRSLLSADEAYVELDRRACLHPSGLCGVLTGTAGDGDAVLVLREQNRWWVTAQPLRWMPS